MPESLPPTTRLYYDDAQLVRFSAQLVAVADDGRTVYLDRTAFYPTSGGQPHDRGTLAELAVIDVVDHETVIAHHLAEPIGLPLGAMVVGSIDWARRFDHMQQHTGQHLLSALLADRYGWPTVSVHFGEMLCTVDVEAADVDPQLLPTIEQEVNTAAVANHAVSVSYEDAATAEGLRKASDRSGQLRIVTIDGLDRSACGGTHVPTTGAIGPILLRRVEKTRGNSRIEFVCGHRAIARAREDAELLTRAARPLSAAPQDLPALVEQQQQRVATLERDRKRLIQELATFNAAQRWAQTTPDAGGVRRIHVAHEGAVREAEPLAQALLAHGPCAVLCTTSDGGILLAASPESGIDAGQQLKSALQQAGGRGGGSPRLAQGTTPPASLASLISTLGF